MTTRRHPAPFLVVLTALASAAVVTACGPEHDDASAATSVARATQAETAPAPRAQPVQVAQRTAPAVQRHMGRVRAIEAVTETKRPTGAGAVIGGVAGGVVGHQFGGGRGQTATTIVGAVGGAVAGNEIETRRRGEEVVGYRVTVAMDDGDTRTVRVASRDGLDVGERVRVEGDQLIRP
jgi:outer membrane lipoprotein SlyB